MRCCVAGAGGEAGCLLLLFRWKVRAHLRSLCLLGVAAAAAAAAAAVDRSSELSGRLSRLWWTAVRRGCCSFGRLQGIKRGIRGLSRRQVRVCELRMSFVLDRNAVKKSMPSYLHPHLPPGYLSFLGSILVFTTHFRKLVLDQEL